VDQVKRLRDPIYSLDGTTTKGTSTSAGMVSGGAGQGGENESEWFFFPIITVVCNYARCRWFFVSCSVVDIDTPRVIHIQCIPCKADAIASEAGVAN